MGLFSNKVRQPKDPLFIERELEFNKEKLNAAIIKQSEALYTYRHDESHKVFADFVRQFLNLEILHLADGKSIPDSEMTFRRGRISALRDLLNAREVVIRNKEELRKKSNDPKAQEAKRSYVRSPATQAGLSI